MRRPSRYAIILLSLFAIAAFTWQVGLTQSEETEYFPQTKHSIQGEFLAFYRAAPNPALVYGYPITEAFTDRAGLRVQYFQRARFERSADGGIRLTPVGDALYEPGNPVIRLDSAPAACRTFETGFQVCMDFLRFYDAHGGSAQFGLPISGIEKEGLRFVQYFEDARLEWVPESGVPGLHVQLGPLGRLLFDAEQENPGRLQPVETSNIIEVTSLRAHAFPERAAIPSGGGQQIFVVVQDQAYAPVAGVEVQLTASVSQEQTILLQGVTNAHGFAVFQLTVDERSVRTGPVQVEASANYAGLTASTRTSYRLAP